MINDISWGSYSSIFHLGHRAVKDLFTVPTILEEKVDGSQFSFGMFEDGLRFRSKGAILYPEAPEKMFSKGVAEVNTIAHLLQPGFTYRGEYLQKPRHNVLAYNRTPVHNIILFDIQDATGAYLEYGDKAKEAQRIELEVVPCLGHLVPGDDGLKSIRAALDQESILGGNKIEGVVVKPYHYDLYGVDKKILMGKFVSEAFKEVAHDTWKKDNPSRSDVVEALIASYRQPGRFQKGVIHLREQGLITGTPKDIGILVKAVQEDLMKEEADNIKEKLFSFFAPQIRRAVTGGLPEWYKETLLKAQFDETEGEA